MTGEGRGGEFHFVKLSWSRDFDTKNGSLVSTFWMILVSVTVYWFHYLHLQIKVYRRQTNKNAAVSQARISSYGDKQSCVTYRTNEPIS